MSLQMISEDVAIKLDEVSSMRKLPNGNALICVYGKEYESSVSFDMLMEIINEPTAEPATVVRTFNDFAG